MNIGTDIQGETLNIAIEGLLDSQTAPALQDVLEENLDKAMEVNFDLTALEYLTSAGLRAILRAQQVMEKKNGKMVVKNVSEDIMGIFNATGFSALLNIE